MLTRAYQVCPEPGLAAIANTVSSRPRYPGNCVARSNGAGAAACAAWRLARADGVELQPKSGRAIRQFAARQRLEFIVERSIDDIAQRRIQHSRIEQLDLEGRLICTRRSGEQITKATEEERRNETAHGVFARQYWRDNSQWARERSGSARSPKGARALMA
jgi:hypothetical protein